MSASLPLRTGARPASTVDRRRGSRSRLPRRFWVYAAFALVYGICETMNGNWSSLDIEQLGGTATMASVALTAFWASVTLGRLFFASIQRHLSTRRTYQLLPFVLAVVFVGIATLPNDEPVMGVVAFGLAGLGCSALLPLTISFGQEELTAMSASVAGGVIAFYQLGYGIAAFGAGPLQSAGVDLGDLFAVAGALALVLGGLAFVIERRRSAPVALHPRPL